MLLNNTLTHQLEDFNPLKDDEITIYSCGPTVYDYPHIGNLRAFVVTDTLRRTIQAAFPSHKVKHVMNITDVDDKTIKRSQEEYPDLSPMDALDKLATKYTNAFLDDMKAIGNNVDALTIVRATDKESIKAMQELIGKLHRNGFAYISEDGVYFSINAYKQSGKTYGQLVEITDENTSDARIDNDEYDKDSAHDFALWKLQKSNEPAWGFMLDGKSLPGRPGWHIECSAMSELFLGKPTDIHTGGVDLMFPHHENEIAQSTAGSDKIYAKFFVHNAHILIAGQKMSKSLGNVNTLKDIVNKGFDPLDLRHLFLQSHYQNQMNFTWDGLTDVKRSLKYLRDNINWVYNSFVPNREPLQALDSSFSKFNDSFLEAFADNLDSPKAISLLHEYVEAFVGVPASRADIPAIEAFDDSVNKLFGIRILDKRSLTKEQKLLFDKRNVARSDGDWELADELRNQLQELGVEINDIANGESTWARTS